MKKLRSRSGIVVAAVAAIGAFALPSTAGATVRSTKITSPTDPSYPTENFADPTPTRFHFAGTADADPGDTVRVVCTGNGNNQLVADNVPVVSGAFSSAATADATHPQDPLVSSIDNGACTLRALPESFGGTDVSKFTGPRLGYGYLSGNKYTFDSGNDTDPPNTNPNKNKLYDFYDETYGLGGYSDYDSLASCGVDDMTVWLGGNSFRYPNRELFSCAGYPWPSGDGFTPGLSVDGHPAYTAYGVYKNEGYSSTTTKKGVPSFTYTATREPISGELTINEADQLAYCMDDNATPADTSDDKPVDTVTQYPTCSYYKPLDVTANRKITTSHGGIQATLADSYTSPTAHKISALYETDFNDSVSVKFAGSSGFNSYEEYGSVAPPSSVPTTFYINGASEYPEGSDQAPQGAVTTDTAWDALTWYANDGYYMAYQNRDIPAGGAFKVSTTYTAGVTQADVEAAAKPVEDAGAAPAVSITSPAGGSTVTSSPVTVSGKATDNVGVTSLTLNGTAVPVGADGSYSAPVTLTPGVNTITAIAKDGAGNTAQAAVQVTYKAPTATCTVPKVLKKSLTAAKKAITAAGCAVGKVKAVKATKKAKAGRVAGQSPAGGKVVPAGTKVNLKVAKKAKPKRKK